MTLILMCKSFKREPGTVHGPYSLVCFLTCHTGCLHYTEGTFLEQAKEVETSCEELGGWDPIQS